MSPADLLTPEHPRAEYRTAAAPDPVVVARLSDGGLISYRKADGTYLHTLNSPAGFARKLRQLGIEPADATMHVE